MEKKIWQIKPLHDLLHLLYPNTCAACGRTLTQQEQVLCLLCEYELPQTNYHQDRDNPVMKKFWGKLPLQHAASLYNFSKHSEVQQLVHHLKYSNWGEIGIFLGKLYARKLKDTDFAKADLIMPVPLHPNKLAKRGYNQSEMFGQGLSEVLKIPLDTHTLTREVNNESQTKKSRIARWLNTKTSFVLNNPDAIAHKHILLVDDVITTGATIQGCTQKIMAIPGIRISVLSIADVEH
jgi:ComF family protein